MRSFFRCFLAVAALMSLTSCTNWLIRQECEKVNWYEHGYKVAMTGKRLSGDTEVDRCRKAEYDLPEQQLDLGFKAGMSNYCKPEIVLATGKAGDFFNTDLCDHGQVNLLKQKHQEGVRFYCSTGNAFSAGASGKKYQSICPADLETAFLPEYKRGRKKYLGTMISQAQREELQVERKILDGERQKAMLTTRLALLPRPRSVQDRVYNSTTGSYTEQTRTEDPAARERDRLNNEMNGVDTTLRSQRQLQERLREEISQHERELATLD